jgi:hypothetical protein
MDGLKAGWNGREAEGREGGKEGACLGRRKRRTRRCRLQIDVEGRLARRCSVDEQ